MTRWVQRSARAFAALPAPRRYLLLAGWVLVLTLLLVLLGRPLLAVWKDGRQWQVLAQQAAGLKPATRFSSEHWQALASARGLVLTRVEQRGDIWLLQGELPSAEALGQLMNSVQEQGGQPLRWSLEQGRQGLVFSLDVGSGGARS